MKKVMPGHLLRRQGKRSDMVQEEKRWWERRELEIQVVVLTISVFLFILGVLLPSAIMAGAGFLGAIFALTYIAYAYVRRLR